VASGSDPDPSDHNDEKAHFPTPAIWKSVVRLRLQAKGWNQSDLAREIGSTPAAVSHVLTKAKHSALRPAIDAALQIKLQGAPWEASGVDSDDAGQLTAIVTKLNEINRARLLERAQFLLELQLAERKVHEGNAVSRKMADLSKQQAVNAERRRRAETVLVQATALEQKAREELRRAELSRDPKRIASARHLLEAQTNERTAAERFVAIAQMADADARHILESSRVRAEESRKRTEALKREIAEIRQMTGEEADESEK
jgi:hypothetical protein